MKVFRDLIFLLAGLALCVFLYGCPLLFIGGLGYTGYQYHEKEGVFAPGQPLGGPAPADQNGNQSSTSPKSAPTPSANDIE